VAGFWVPGAVRIAVMINPGNAATAEATLREVQKAAGALGLQIHVVNASTSGEISAAFATISRERAEALFVAPDAFFNSRRVQLVTLSARDRIPTAYSARSRPSCRLFSPLNLSLSSICKPPKRSASTCHPVCCWLPMR
jgi:putative ABC transport system substrate-binding protein